MIRMRKTKDVVEMSVATGGKVWRPRKYLHGTILIVSIVLVGLTMVWALREGLELAAGLREVFQRSE